MNSSDPPSSFQHCGLLSLEQSDVSPTIAPQIHISAAVPRLLGVDVRDSAEHPPVKAAHRLWFLAEMPPRWFSLSVQHFWGGIVCTCWKVWESMFPSLWSVLFFPPTQPASCTDLWHAAMFSFLKSQESGSCILEKAKAAVFKLIITWRMRAKNPAHCILCLKNMPRQHSKCLNFSFP